MLKAFEKEFPSRGAFWFTLFIFFQWKAGTTDSKYWGAGDPPSADADDR